jgi:hypothetical protein
MFKRIVPIFLLCGSFVYAAENPSSGPAVTVNPPSEASIKQLLEVTQARKLVDSIMAQMDNLMQQAVVQAAAGREIPESVQKEIDRQRAETIAMMKQLLDWQKLEPMYVRIYQKTFTQAELDGMLAFYKTPAGAAVITKMPAIMQSAMDEMQGMMGPVMEKVQRLQQDVAARMKDGKKSKGG